MFVTAGQFNYSEVRYIIYKFVRISIIIIILINAHAVLFSCP